MFDAKQARINTDSCVDSSLKEILENIEMLSKEGWGYHYVDYITYKNKMRLEELGFLLSRDDNGGLQSYYINWP